MPNNNICIRFHIEAMFRNFTNEYESTRHYTRCNAKERQLTVRFLVPSRTCRGDRRRATLHQQCGRAV